jgi:hypothetical protein
MGEGNIGKTEGISAPNIPYPSSPLKGGVDARGIHAITLGVRIAICIRKVDNAKTQATKADTEATRARTEKLRKENAELIREDK